VGGEIKDFTMQPINLKQLLEDSQSRDLDRQYNAIKKIKELKTHKTICVLIDLLSSDEWYIKDLAIEALLELSQNLNQTVGAAITNLLLDREMLVRDSAVNALAELSYTPAISKIQDMLCHDPDPVVRASAAEVLSDLSEVDNPEVLNALKSALDDPVEFVRSYAVHSIGYLGTVDFLPMLNQHFISEESLDVRVAILEAKYRLGENSEDIIKLVDFLNFANEHLAGIILRSLQKLIEDDYGFKIVSDAPQIRETIARIIQSFPLEKFTANEILEELHKYKIGDSS